jgi:hypothetical protein
MSKKKADDNSKIAIWVAIIGLAGTVITALFGYITANAPFERANAMTQTAEAKTQTAVAKLAMATNVSTTIPTLTPTQSPTSAATTIPRPMSTATSTPNTTPTATLLTLFDDNFADNNVSIFKWFNQQGKWTAKNGEYFMEVSNTLQQGLSLAGVTTPQDYVFQFEVKGDTSEEKVAVFGYFNDKDTYHVNLRADPINDLILVRGMPGSEEVLARKTTPNLKKTWYQLKVVVVGSSIQIFVGDNQFADIAYDTKSRVLGGRVGLFAWPNKTMDVTNYFRKVKVFAIR